ncbi:tctex1 domain-containing protein 2-like [Agrilus planipennis]|uniref:Tctex1 domain-containing protein 2-like n=1 Tax=Agrilus planipennis TaxID=224129 RepID=A0A7F5RLP3_AGRPL|nr:tctex1 domain-containing protein 2-like [Agrilus planipennis]
MDESMKSSFLERENVTPISSSYQMKPPAEDKFQELMVKEIVRNILAESLAAKKYDSETIKNLTTSIANRINHAVKELKLKRYKHIVHVNMGERRGQGVKSGFICLWDSETDTDSRSERGRRKIVYRKGKVCLKTLFKMHLFNQLN